MRLYLAFIIFSILLIGCSPVSRLDNDTEKLIINFNGQSKMDMKAATYINQKSTLNRDFQDYFISELGLVSADLDEIDRIEVEDWHQISNQAYLSIDYVSSVSMDQRRQVIKAARSELEKKWYVKSIQYVPIYD